MLPQSLVSLLAVYLLQQVLPYLDNGSGQWLSSLWAGAQYWPQSANPNPNPNTNANANYQQYFNQHQLGPAQHLLSPGVDFTRQFFTSTAPSSSVVANPSTFALQPKPQMATNGIWHQQQYNSSQQHQQQQQQQSYQFQQQQRQRQVPSNRATLPQQQQQAPVQQQQLPPQQAQSRSLDSFVGHLFGSDDTDTDDEHDEHEQHEHDANQQQVPRAPRTHRAIANNNNNNNGVGGVGGDSTQLSYGAFIKDCLQTHDKYRAMHGVPPLKASKKVMRYSRRRAKELAETDHFAHPASSPYGENLAFSSFKGTTCSELMKMWYDEIGLYNWKNPSFNSEIGHFTQLVWKDSVRIGCARGFSKRGKGVYLVCNYDPPGNVFGEFRSQVSPLKAAPHQPRQPLLPTSSVAPVVTLAPVNGGGNHQPSSGGVSNKKKKKGPTTVANNKKKKQNQKQKKQQQQQSVSTIQPSLAG